MNKNINLNLSWGIKTLRYYLLTIMRTFLLLLTIGLSSAFANTSYSQTKINIDVNDITLEDLFKEIQSKSEFVFFYKDAVLNNKTKISLKLKKVALSTILDQAFSNTSLSYTIDDRQVVIKKREIIPTLLNKPDVTTRLSQGHTVTGTIKDINGAPLSGANILEKGTINGIQTDFDGKFSIDVKDDKAILVISYVGFATQEIVVGNQKTIFVILRETASALDEVIVVGYGTQKKINLTGAVTQVKSEEFIDERPVTSLGQALQGVAPGLTVTKSNGIPGAGHSYNIRGITSINGGSPLILVDGSEMDPNLVPPNDVESVSILKDAASAAIYGARAAFGVILITTKSGKTNHQPKFTYTANKAWSNPTILPDKVDPITQIKTGLIQWENAGRTPGVYWERNAQIWLDLYASGNNLDGIENVNGVWYPLGNNNDMLDFMVEQSVTTSHNLSVTAGSDKTTYYLSAGLMENNGIIVFDKDKYIRKNILSKIDTNINKWLSLGVTLGFSRGVQNMPYIPNNSGYMYDVSYIRPTFWLTGIDEVSGKPWGFSPEMVRLGAKNRNLTDNINIQTRIVIKPFEGFNLTGTYSFRSTTSNDKYHVNTYEMANPTSGAGIVFKYRNDPNSLRKTASFDDFNNASVTGDYTKTLDKNHNFKIMLGYSQEDYRQDSFWAERQKLISDDIPSLNLATGNQVADDAITTWSTRSVFSRFNYNYQEKYLLEAVSRYDGSSRFHKKDRFVYSPSASIGWIVSKESFMEGSKNWLNYFKIRASLGSQGNQQVSPYAYISNMGTGTSNWIINGERPLYVRPGGLVSDSFTWEKVKTTNFGVDLGFFKNKLSVTAEIYKRETLGMLTAAVELPDVLGTSAPQENSANLKVNGWELSFNWKDNLSDDFAYNIGINVWDSKAIITKFDGNLTGQLNNHYVGRELGEIWGYTTDRLFQEDDFVIDGSGQRGYAPGLPTQNRLFSNRIPFPGDVKYKDLNDDGVLDFGTNTLEDHGDLKVIGNSSSRYQFNINLGVSYKNFDLNVFMQGVAKKDLWTSGPFGFTAGEQYTTIFAHTLDYWTPENTDAFYPRPDDRSYNKQVQTKYLLNAAYLRFKNIKLGYNLSKNIVQKIGLESVKFYVSGENLLLLSGMPKGLDPELGTSHTYPLRKDFSIGTSITF